ncbi:MAG: HD domain-containing protein [Clostridiales bacterium]|nr:HD domain-containing protein [Clostridiales bacterium]
MHIDINDEVNIDEVIEFATERHRGQLRSDGQEYITHPLRVSDIVSKYKPSQNANILRAGAILHDVLEDTYTSYRELQDRFGEVIASLVMEVTSSTFMPKLVGKQIYLAHKMQYMSSYALIIKLADRLDNISDLKGLKPEKIKKTFYDTIYMINYIENKRILTDAQSNLVEAIRAKLSDINKQYHFASGSLVSDSDLDQDEL